MERRQSTTVRWEWILDAWKVFSGAALTWMLMQAVVAIFLLLGVSPIIFLLGGIGVLASREAWPAIAGLSVVALILIPVLLVVLVAGSAFLVSGFYKAAIRKARGEEISLADLFTGGDTLLPVLGFLVLLALGVSTIGGILGVIGGGAGSLGSLTSFARTVVNLLILGLTLFALPLIVDQRCGIVDALRKSLAITRPHWPMYLLLALVIEVLSGAGLVFCFVGIILTSHFQWTIPAVAYCDLFGLTPRHQDDRFPTPPPPPDYRQPWAEPALAEAPTLPLVCHHCGAPRTSRSQFCAQCGERQDGSGS